MSRASGAGMIDEPKKDEPQRGGRPEAAPAEGRVRHEKDKEPQDSVPPHRVPPPMERASESIVNPATPDSDRRGSQAKQTTAIESGEIEISPASFAAPSSSAASANTASLPPSSFDPPPSAIIANAMGRGKQRLSLGAIVGIGSAIFLVLVGLSLLLFR